MAFKSHLDGKFGRRRHADHQQLQQMDDDDIEDPSVANHSSAAHAHIHSNGHTHNGIDNHTRSPSSVHRGDALFDDADDDRATEFNEHEVEQLKMLTAGVGVGVGNASGVASQADPDGVDIEMQSTAATTGKHSTCDSTAHAYMRA